MPETQPTITPAPKRPLPDAEQLVKLATAYAAGDVLCLDALANLATLCTLVGYAVREEHAGRERRLARALLREARQQGLAA